MNMNYSQIKTNYPRAFEEYIYSPYSEEDSDRRDLYDFFDEHGIYIILDKVEFEEGIEWSFDICGYSEHGYNSRKEAESAAFTKAFEILNDKL